MRRQGSWTPCCLYLGRIAANDVAANAEAAVVDDHILHYIYLLYLYHVIVTIDVWI